MSILITGATGTLGVHVTRKLKELYSNSKIYVISRYDRHIAGCELIKLDLRHKDQAEDRLKEILDTVEYVIHMAADVRWNQSYKNSIDKNINTTQNLVDIIEKYCRKINKFVFVSTAFVACPPNPLATKRDKGKFFHNYYEMSKALSENCLTNSKLPWMIVRPSIIVGDRYAGSIAKYNGLYTVFRAGFTGILPIIVGNPDSQIDIVPVDIVVDSIVSAIQTPETESIIWAISGSQSPSVSKLVNLLETETNQIRCDSKLDPREETKIIDNEVYQRLYRPLIKSHIKPQKFLVIETMECFIPYFSMPQPFEIPVSDISYKSSLPNDFLTKIIKKWCDDHKALILKESFDWTKALQLK